MLTNPIWHALTTEQTHFAVRNGDAARFQPEVTALAGLREPTDAALAALAGLLAPGDVLGILLDAPLALPPSLARVDAAPVLQMLHDGPAPTVGEPLEVLG